MDYKYFSIQFFKTSKTNNSDDEISRKSRVKIQGFECGARRGHCKKVSPRSTQANQRWDIDKRGNAHTSWKLFKTHRVSNISSAEEIKLENSQKVARVCQQILKFRVLQGLVRS